MKRGFKISCMLLAMLIFIGSYATVVFAETSPGAQTATILFTHDMHAHFMPVKVNVNGTHMELGGYARLKTAINAEKQGKPDALLVDAGDFSMGTLFQAIYASDAPDLRMLGQLGYEAVTLGNHEFDFRGEGLAASLNTAVNSGNRLPSIVLSNFTYPPDENGNLSQTLTELKDAMDGYGVKDYIVLNKGGVKIGVFGLMGIEAAADSPMSDIKFTDQIENSKRVVKILKETEKVDLVVCLSHSGTWIDKSVSEDEILAKKVPGIDVIVSGHTHTKLENPIIVGNTTIVSCGENGENLGILDLTRDSGGAWKVNNYKLRQIDSSFAEDTAAAKTIEMYKAVVQAKYLDTFNLKFDQVLANSPFDFTDSSKIGAKHAEDTLGNLITDAYIYAVKQAEGANYEPVAMAIAPKGVIRGSFITGNIAVSDVFNVSSLGIGKDGVSGYPLISVYLTGKEIKTACEVDASISPIMSDAQLYMSGVSFTFNPNRLIFNKVTSAFIQKNDTTFETIDDKKLYRVIAGLYSAQMLSVVGEKSYGLLSIVPKTKDGAPITDFEAQIIYDNSTGTKNEVKEWLSLASYLKSFDKTGGIAQVPAYYNETHDRKIVDDNKNILAIIGNPNSIAMVVYSIAILTIALIVFIIVMIITRKKRKAKRSVSRRKQRKRKIENVIKSGHRDL